MGCHQRKKYATKDILEVQIGLNNIIISAITKMELLVGARNKEEEKKIIKNLRSFSVALLNDEITNEALMLLQKYRLSHGLSIPDSLIAATAKITALELFSYNIRDYKFISGLNLYTP